MDKTVPSGRVKGTLTPPCSKSYAQRALAASLLCEETSVLRNIEFCSDTRSALQCIETLGARVTRIGEETLSIEGGLRPQGHTLRVGESGLSTRLFTPIASLCGTPITIEGEGTLLRRPMEMMTGPLRTLGVRVRDNGGFLPFEVRGPIGFVAVHHGTHAGAAAGPTRHHDPCAERGFDPLSGHDHRHRGPFRRGNLP